MCNGFCPCKGQKIVAYFTCRISLETYILGGGLFDYTVVMTNLCVHMYP